jgi:hypothetical protein
MTEYSVPTPVHIIPVRNRYVMQWLQTMNIPVGKPMLLQFEYEEVKREAE